MFNFYITGGYNLLENPNIIYFHFLRKFIRVQSFLRYTMLLFFTIQTVCRENVPEFVILVFIKSPFNFGLIQKNVFRNDQLWSINY